jgi:hypothetical protein
MSFHEIANAALASSGRIFDLLSPKWEIARS